MIRLVNHSLCPPGEFFIRVRLVNGETVPEYSDCDQCYKFGPGPEIDRVAAQYAEFLKGNKLPGSDFASALKAVDSFTCTRLGGSNRWCYNTEQPYVTRSINTASGAGCGSCGAPVA